MRKCLLIGIAIVVLLIVVLGIFALEFNLSALPNPGPIETRLANAGKRFLIGRYARKNSFTLPAATPEKIAGSQMNFGGECAACHGTDGRTPSDIGSAMYPRALDLGSPQVQQFSDVELFWIIKNGIRLSGMPGFARTLSDDQIANMVLYVRELAKSPSAQAASN